MKYRVFFDSEAVNCFRVMLPGREVVFNILTNGLHYHDTEDRSIVLFNAVAENCKVFTCQEYEDAKAARCALGLVGYPSERDFTNMVSSNIIVNFPVTPQDVKNSDKIFGPDVLSIKGKSIRRCLEAVVSNYVNTPKEILSMDTGLEVFVGVVFVNKLAFLVSVIRRLKLTLRYVINSG